MESQNAIFCVSNRMVWVYFSKLMCAKCAPNTAYMEAPTIKIGNDWGLVRKLQQSTELALEERAILGELGRRRIYPHSEMVSKRA